MCLRKPIVAALMVWGSMAPLHAAAAEKVLHATFNAPETGFDPAKISDVYSAAVIEHIYDPLLTFDYLARPVKVIPNVVTSMPTVSDGGKTYTFHLKKGIYFAPDPAFKGKKRELTAADYVYTIKRLSDPLVASPISDTFTGKLVGLDELVKKAGKGGLNYDTVVEGVKTLDRYTLQLRFKEPFPSLPYVLAGSWVEGQAREVIEAYGDNTNAHPVGTGPYMLSEWKPGNHMTLVRNPNFRQETFRYQAGSDALGRKIASQMNGKRYPQIDRIDISVIEEEQPTWLAFKSGELDVLSGNPSIPQPLIRQVLRLDPKDSTRAELRAELRDKGVQLSRSLEEGITFYAFNMQDPVVGGYGKDRIALRRAIAMAFDQSETIRDIRRGQALPVQYIIPPNVSGHNPDFRAAYPYNPALANALLDQFGYKIGADGYRNRPDGKPFTVDYLTGPTAIDKQWNEYWQKAFDRIKLRINFRVMQWNEQVKALRECKYGLAGGAWGADYPDGDDFMQLLYGPNTGGSNYACYQSSRYDSLYVKSRVLPDGPERNRLYDQMNKLVVADTPWVFSDIRYTNGVAQPWVRGFKVHPNFNAIWRFLDVQK
ncbi:ABC transporter substrate-binding protein [Chromobacterium sphagni]|uniref:ABC transporter substrate-binding protein n=1 Tax=Chromobacterium sphagni TaxID=1903179 RepID=A0A1S1X5G0_9NEIS|nr:ABC transporter substrate-binding protein [Chromobacterium sphagni]OHX14721.1 ABC transporter substrate-binding protein [Chromobacterium sphagni]OHX20752.1 ABC transporter substrate-binding protein [Chromobacterium sphagni]